MNEEVKKIVCPYCKKGFNVNLRLTIKKVIQKSQKLKKNLKKR